MTDPIDPVRFPRVAAYLQALPHGVASYPECRAKGSIARSALEDRPITDLPRGSLPDPVIRIAERFPPYSGWVAEAELMCLSLAFADYHRLSDAAYVARKYEQNRRLFGTFAYRLLMAFSSPQSILERATARWGALHQGTRVHLQDPTATSATLVLEHPVGLYTPLLLELYAAVFRAALDHAGAKGSEVRLTGVEPTRGVFLARWG